MVCLASAVWSRFRWMHSMSQYLKDLFDIATCLTNPCCTAIYHSLLLSLCVCCFYLPRVKLKEGMAFLGARPSNPTLWMVSQDVRSEGHRVVTLHCRRKESSYGQRSVSNTGSPHWTSLVYCTHNHLRPSPEGPLPYNSWLQYIYIYRFFYFIYPLFYQVSWLFSFAAKTWGIVTGERRGINEPIVNCKYHSVGWSEA
jgi:hypothetical protein